MTESRTAVGGDRRRYRANVTRGEATLLLWLVKQGDFTGQDYTTACHLSMRALNVIMGQGRAPKDPETFTRHEAALVAKLVGAMGPMGERRRRVAKSLASRAGDVISGRVEAGVRSSSREADRAS